MNGLVSTTFTLEQNSGFKLERNKDLTFIVIIIDIDWYEKNYRDNFFGHIAQPYLGWYALLVILKSSWQNWLHVCDGRKRVFSNHIFETLWFNAVSRRKYSAMVLTDEIAHGLSWKILKTPDRDRNNIKKKVLKVTYHENLILSAIIRSPVDLPTQKTWKWLTQ